MGHYIGNPTSHCVPLHIGAGIFVFIMVNAAATLIL